MSGTVLGIVVRLKSELVWTDIFSSNFDDCFERNLLTVNPIDPIILPMTL
jgi:hypothetical protein